MTTKLFMAILGLALSATLLLQTASPCAAAETDQLQEEVSRLIKLVDEQGKQLQEQQKRIDELSTQPAPDREQDKIPDTTPQRPEPPVVAPQSPAGSSQEPAVTSGPVGIPPTEKPEKRLPEIATVFDQPGVLTPRGSLILEPSLQYSYSSNSRIALFGYTIIPAITIGVIDIRQITTDNFVGAITTRYGLTNRLELEARVPYVYRSETTITRPSNVDAANESVFDLNDSNIGDIEFGVRYQLNQPVTGPFYIASLRVKSDTGQGPFDLEIDPETNLWTELATGSGFWAVQPGLTVIFPSDPAVFFGGVNYLWHIERDVGNAYGKVDPGDVFGMNLGMGVAINEKASFTIGYEHSVIGTSRYDGEKLPGDNTLQVGTLSVGYAYRLSKKTNINLSLGVGVTEYSPDVQITLRIPFNL